MANGRMGDGRGHQQPPSGKDAEHAAGILQRFNQRVAGLRATAVRRPGGLQLWRISVAVLGAVLVVIGAILLVIPGPGWLVIFLGLGIWATEFAWARSLLRYGQRQARRWTAWMGRQPRWLAVTVGAAGLIAIGVVVWFLVT
jgi:uncharacterized protein (TIGR02611 family)